MAFKPVKYNEPIKDFFILVKLSKVTFTFLLRKTKAYVNKKSFLHFICFKIKSKPYVKI